MKNITATLDGPHGRHTRAHAYIQINIQFIIFIIYCSKLPPQCQTDQIHQNPQITRIHNLLQDRILPLVNNIFLILLIRCDINDDDRLKMIERFFNQYLVYPFSSLSLPSHSINSSSFPPTPCFRHHSINYSATDNPDYINPFDPFNSTIRISRFHLNLFGDIVVAEIDELTFTKIYFLLLVLHNFDDVPASLHSKLISDPTKTANTSPTTTSTAITTASPTFCLMKTFFDTLNDYPQFLLFSPSNLLNIFNYESNFPSKTSPPPPEADSPSLSPLDDDSLYIQIVTTLCTFMIASFPSLFPVIEYHLLESLMCSPNIMTCTLIIDSWGCMNGIMMKDRRYRGVYEQQIQLLSEMVCIYSLS